MSISTADISINRPNFNPGGVPVDVKTNSFEADAREEEQPQDLRSVPDILLQGVFAQVSDALGRRDWETWLGTLGALCARAHRNLWLHYHSSFIYGNAYSLLIN